VVAGRERDHAATSHLVVQGRERVVGATELERADPLEVLALQEHRATDTRVDGPRGQHRGAVRDALERARGTLDVVERDRQRTRRRVVAVWSSVASLS
jgi:hypothetical protein